MLTSFRTLCHVVTTNTSPLAYSFWNDGQKASVKLSCLRFLCAMQAHQALAFKLPAGLPLCFKVGKHDYRASESLTWRSEELMSLPGAFLAGWAKLAKPRASWILGS
eukprot:156314-Amphidinium_carterae.1